MGKSKWRRSGRGFDGSNTRSDGSETEDRRNNAERAGGCERGEEGNWERGMDLHSKKTRNFESEGRFVVGRRDSILEGDLRLKLAKRKREEESSPHRDLRHKIKSKKSCIFSEEESCRGRRLSNGEHSRHKQNNQERLKEVGEEFIYLRDKTCTVETLDLEEHFSKYKDAAKVKFVGKKGGSNIFKVVVTATWQSNQMRSFYTIRGVELEVESKTQRSGEKLQGEAERTHDWEKTGWWETHLVQQRGAREDWEVKEANTVEREDRQAHRRRGTRDLQEVQLELPRLVKEDAAPCIRGEIVVQMHLNKTHLR